MFYLFGYIASVLAINYGFSATPQWDIFWSAWAGLIFVLRDMVQVRYGHGSLLAMLGASLLSYWLAEPAIAIASVAAFGASEAIDWIVFTLTKRTLRDRLWLSAAASIPVDTVLFFWLADMLHVNVILVSMLSKFVGVSAIWLIMRARQQPR